jgi:hypothetical protein
VAGNAVANAPIKAGAALGAAGGYTQGLNDNLEGAELAKSVGTGAVIGGALGSIPALKRLATGETASKKQIQSAMNSVIPEYSQLTPTQKKQFVKKGLVEPRTLTKGQKVRLSDSEIATVQRNSDIITRDPVQTSINIQNKIENLDAGVEQFLLKNNGIFPKNELKTSVMSSLDDVLDISPEQKTKLVDNFMKSLDKNDMHSLWKARKAFDQKIETAFSGSFSTQKELKKAMRNSVQDFLANKTPDKTYKTFMKDMSGLYNIADLVDIGVAKQYAGSRAGEAVNTTVRKLGTAGAVAGGLGGAYFLGNRATGGGE